MLSTQLSSPHATSPRRESHSPHRHRSLRPDRNIWREFSLCNNGEIPKKTKSASYTSVVRYQSYVMERPLTGILKIVKRVPLIDESDRNELKRASSEMVVVGEKSSGDAGSAKLDSGYAYNGDEDYKTATA